MLGGYAVERDAQSRVIAVVVAALIGIFVFLQAAFSSWRLALLVFAALPLALSGGVLAVAASGAEVSLGSVAGLVAIVGLATHGTVLLIRNYEEREQRGEPFGGQLVVDGTTELLMPALVPLVGLAALFIPAAAASSMAGLEIVGPMAIVVVGGLITTALLLGVVVPSFYLHWGYIANPDTTAHDLFEPATPHLVIGGD
ncbi:MAG: efflux RND transporter permease subunit [Acidimicrobiia bacterium]|nr:efflux RND transporter permease subunit [Acidimicrobiia bacterium]